MLSFLLIFFLVPETAGATVSKEEGKLNYMSLEELKYIFGVPTSKHIHDQFEYMIKPVLDNFSSHIRRVFLFGHEQGKNGDAPAGYDTERQGDETTLHAAVQESNDEVERERPQFGTMYTWLFPPSDDVVDEAPGSAQKPEELRVEDAIAVDSDVPHVPQSQHLQHSNGATTDLERRLIDLIRDFVPRLQREIGEHQHVE